MATGCFCECAGEPVACPAQVRSIDRRASEVYGLPTLVLMENAGAAIAREALKLLAAGRPPRAVILCGKGQNGGDGLVAARHLSASGTEVHVFLAARAAEVVGDAAVNLLVLKQMTLTAEGGRSFGGGVRLTVLDEGADQPGGRSHQDFLAGLLEAVSEGGLIIDALLGTGFRPPLSPIFADLIRIANNSGRPVLAADVPSGLDAAGGIPGEPCIRAVRTVTFGLLKPGLLLNPGRDYCGQVVSDRIGLPPGAVELEGISLFRTGPETVRAWIPRRRPDDHKGSHGHLLVLAGSPGYTGAAALSSKSALRSGAGLVTLGVPDQICGPMVRKVTEVIVRGFPATGDGCFAPEAAAAVLGGLSKVSAVAMGPGLGLGAGEFVRLILPGLLERGWPAVLDADGIRAFAGNPGELRRTVEKAASPEGRENAPAVVITPHPGEMGALLGLSPAEVQENRIAIARRAAAETGCVAVLKGAPTVIADSTRAFINSTGNPVLATAGSGDVLTGVIGALLADGVPALEAALTGVYLHGLAGDLLAARHGTVGLTAGDVARALPRAIKEAAVN